MLIYSLLIISSAINDGLLSFVVGLIVMFYVHRFGTKQNEHLVVLGWTFVCLRNWTARLLCPSENVMFTMSIVEDVVIIVSCAVLIVKPKGYIVLVWIICILQILPSHPPASSWQFTLDTVFYIYLVHIAIFDWRMLPYLSIPLLNRLLSTICFVLIFTLLELKRQGYMFPKKEEDDVEKQLESKTTTTTLVKYGLLSMQV